MKYKWICSACESSNQPDNWFCEACGCPAKTDGRTIEKWQQSLTGQAEKPTLNTMTIPLWGAFGLLAHKVSFCPRCFLHMHIISASCPHCGYELSLPERNALVENYRVTFWHGVKLALVFVPVFLFIVTLMVFIYDSL